MNFDLKIKEISLETFLLTGKINNKEIINNLIEDIKNIKDNSLSNKTNVKGHFTGVKALIQNENFINFLKIIKNEIRIIYPKNFMIQDAWGNICNQGDEVTEHNHLGVTGFCGILYLTENGPGTYFKQHNLLINEEIGKFVLFHPYLDHSVPKLEQKIERITLAFNMEAVKSWENLANHKCFNIDEI